MISKVQNFESISSLFGGQYGGAVGDDDNTTPTENPSPKKNEEEIVKLKEEVNELKNNSFQDKFKELFTRHFVIMIIMLIALVIVIFMLISNDYSLDKIFDNYQTGLTFIVCISLVVSTFISILFYNSLPENESPEENNNNTDLVKPQIDAE